MAKKKKEKNLQEEFFDALDELVATKGVTKEFMINAIETAFVTAYRKNFGTAKAVRVVLNPDKKTFDVIAYKTVVSEVTDPDTEISLTDAQEINKEIKEGETIEEVVTPKDFARVAAGTARQIVLQKMREFERSQAFGELENRVESIIGGTIRKIDNGSVYLELAGTAIEGVLMPNDQIPNEKYNVGDKLKVYIKKLKESMLGVQAIVSRSVPQFVEKIFEIEVPEIASGVVLIKSLAREAGARTKIAIASSDPEVDALGACVGNHGARVNAVVNSLGGEKIDLIVFSDDPFEYIARALSPAKVISVEIDEVLKASKVVVPDNQLSLAIGKGGQNVRLAAKLTGWKIDVKSESASKAQEDASLMSEVETDVSDASEIFDLDE